MVSYAVLIGLQDMIVSSTGFKDFDLLHLSKVVNQMGNDYGMSYLADANMLQVVLTTNILNRQRPFSFANRITLVCKSCNLQSNMVYLPFR